MVKRISVLMTVWALLFGLCACMQKPLTWQEQCELGMRYLSEGNYEEAIIAFTAAIEIDPKQAPAYVGRGDAYIGLGETEDNLTAAQADYEKAIDLDETLVEVYWSLSDVYIKLGDTEAAAELLRRGFELTEDTEFQDALDELAGVVAPTELVQGSEEWTALENFLLRQVNNYYEDYNCETAARPTAEDEWSESGNVLKKMLSVGSCYTYDDELYPGETMEVVWFELGSDPLGKFESYIRVNANKLHWILEHIFNCTPKDIEIMKAPILDGEDENIYYLDEHYYFGIGGIGGPGYYVFITNVELVGMRYYVEYYSVGAYDSAEPEFRCATLSLKEIDGERYWSLYRDSAL